MRRRSERGLLINEARKALAAAGVTGLAQELAAADTIATAVVDDLMSELVTIYAAATVKGARTYVPGDVGYDEWCRFRGNVLRSVLTKVQRQDYVTGDQLRFVVGTVKLIHHNPEEPS